MDPLPATNPTPVDRAINDCWNRIGIQGDGTCPELAVYIHCRNCPVYSAAAATFLDRELPQVQIADWTRHFAQEKPAFEAETVSVVLFRLGVEWFALPVTIFQEISPMKPIHSLPHRRDASVLGLINFRGELLICMSLARMLGLPDSSEPQPESVRGARSRLLILNKGGNRFVFPVDEVGGIHHFKEREVAKAPATVTDAATTFTTGVLSWQGHRAGQLDAELLFHALGTKLS